MFQSRDKHNVKKQFRRYTGLAFAMLLVVSFFTTTLTSTASADPTDPTAGQAAPGANQTTTQQQNANAQTTCSIEKIGWILCPVIQTAGKVGDQAFELLANHFLETEPELLASNDTNGTKIAWELARNLANLMFIAVFIIVILSQVTGRGIDNYGIKKLLPRLIIGAILVNVSYYICQLIVDLSNIMGYEIEHFLVSTAQGVSSQAVFPPETSIDVNTSNGSLGTMALIILGIGAAVWILLPMLALGVTTVVVACIVIVAILLMRKAFVVLLVVASPIAFVMYLLPNTEKFFQKWQKMFIQLLMVFPIVGMLFGGGQLASAIILVAGSNQCTDKTCSTSTYGAGVDKCIQLPSSGKASNTAVNPNQTKTTVADPQAKGGACGKGSTPLMLGLVAAGIAVAPLFAVWAVLKGALAAAGAIGGKISGAIENGTKKGAAGAADKYKNSNFGKYRNRKAEERMAQIQAGTFRGSGKNPMNWSRRARSGLNSKLNENSAFNTVTGGFGGDRGLAAEALNRKDTKEAMDMFAGDDEFMSAWTQSGGNAAAFEKYFADKGKASSASQKDKFKRMKGAGHDRKASSYLAAASYLAENGKGTAADINAGIKAAAGRGATASETGDAFAQAVVQSRKSGRADTLAGLQGGGMDKAFSEIGAANLSKDLFSGANASANLTAYQSHLTTAPGAAENLDKALRGFDKMDARTQEAVKGVLAAAAGATSVQEAKNARNIL
jgi:hypothetical protein